MTRETVPTPTPAVAATSAILTPRPTRSHPPPAGARSPPGAWNRFHQYGTGSQKLSRRSPLVNRITCVAGYRLPGLVGVLQRRNLHLAGDVGQHHPLLGTAAEDLGEERRAGHLVGHPAAGRLGKKPTVVQVLVVRLGRFEAGGHLGGDGRHEGL